MSILGLQGENKEAVSSSFFSEHLTSATKFCTSSTTWFIGSYSASSSLQGRCVCEWGRISLDKTDVRKKLHKCNLENVMVLKRSPLTLIGWGKAALWFNGYKTSNKLQLRVLHILPAHNHFRDLNSFILHFVPLCPSALYLSLLNTSQDGNCTYKREPICGSVCIYLARFFIPTCVFLVW